MKTPVIFINPLKGEYTLIYSLIFSRVSSICVIKLFLNDLITPSSFSLKLYFFLCLSLQKSFFNHFMTKTFLKTIPVKEKLF